MPRGKSGKGPVYEGRRVHALRKFDGGLPHRIIEEYNPSVGKKIEVACSYQVQIGNGEWVEICRYDSCHGSFHRHRAFWPKTKGLKPQDKKIEIIFKNVPVAKRTAKALDDVSANARVWQRLIPKEEVQTNEAS